jgi:hypothetical protein
MERKEDENEKGSQARGHAVEFGAECPKKKTPDSSADDLIAVGGLIIQCCVIKKEIRLAIGG